MHKILAALAAGTVIGGLAAWCYVTKEWEDVFPEFTRPEYDHAYKRAMQAYYQQEPRIAIWELAHLATLQEELLGRERVHTNELRASLVLTRARLARLYTQTDKQPEAATNAGIAIHLLSGFSGTNTLATNLPTLLEHLQRFDDRERQRMFSTNTN